MRIKATVVPIICGLTTVLLLDGCIYLIRCPEEITLGEAAMCEIYYVSSPKERKELKRLNSQEEVERFMEAFWKKLDPTPSTPENELRDEYFKRYNYANANFREGRTTGWRTDRGRVFIIYGPPDEIDVEIMAQSGPTYRNRSLETWQYDRPTSRAKITSSFANLELSCVTFVFADVDGVGSYTQIYSTEEGELDDSRLLRFLSSEAGRVTVGGTTRVMHRGKR